MNRYKIGFRNLNLQSITIESESFHREADGWFHFTVSVPDKTEKVAVARVNAADVLFVRIDGNMNSILESVDSSRIA